MKDKVSNPERRPSLSAVFAVPDAPGATSASHTAPITATAASPMVTFNQSPPPAALLPFPPPVLVGPPRPPPSKRKSGKHTADDDRRSAMAACMTAYQSDRAPRVSHSPYTILPSRRLPRPDLLTTAMKRRSARICWRFWRLSKVTACITCAHGTLTDRSPARLPLPLTPPLPP